jgi:hypothetical protein
LAPFFFTNFVAQEDFGFVDEAVAKLARAGVVRLRGSVLDVLASDVCFVSPLLVARSSAGKLRLCLAATHLNSFLTAPKIVYETLRARRHQFRAGDYFYALDLSSAYHHMALADHHVPYVAFAWRGLVWEFVVCPFGLSPMCAMLTQLLRPLVRYFRCDLGMTLGQYLDDTGGAAPTRAEAQHHALLTASVFFATGFVVNLEKSLFDGLQQCVHLGLGLDFATGAFYIPGGRLSELQSLALLAAAGSLAAALLARFIGLLWASSLALGEGVHVRLHYLLGSLLDAVPPGTERRSPVWQRVLRLDAAARKEATWWVGCLLADPRHPFQLPRLPAVLSVVASDGSDTGGGGSLQLPCGSTLRAFSRFPAAVRLASSTVRELWALIDLLVGARRWLRGAALLVYMDSAVAVGLLRGRRRSERRARTGGGPSRQKKKEKEDTQKKTTPSTNTDPKAATQVAACGESYAGITTGKFACAWGGKESKKKKKEKKKPAESGRASGMSPGEPAGRVLESQPGES